MADFQESPTPKEPTFKKALDDVLFIAQDVTQDDEIYSLYSMTDLLQGQTVHSEKIGKHLVSITYRKDLDDFRKKSNLGHKTPVVNIELHERTVEGNHYTRYSFLGTNYKLDSVKKRTTFLLKNPPADPNDPMLKAIDAFSQEDTSVEELATTFADLEKQDRGKREIVEKAEDELDVSKVEEDELKEVLNIAKEAAKKVHLRRSYVSICTDIFEKSDLSSHVKLDEESVLGAGWDIYYKQVETSLKDGTRALLFLKDQRSILQRQADNSFIGSTGDSTMLVLFGNNQTRIYFGLLEPIIVNKILDDSYLQDIFMTIGKFEREKKFPELKQKENNKDFYVPEEEKMPTNEMEEVINVLTEIQNSLPEQSP